MRRWLGQVLESVLQTAAPNEPNLYPDSPLTRCMSCHALRSADAPRRRPGGPKTPHALHLPGPILRGCAATSANTAAPDKPQVHTHLTRQLPQ